MRLRSQPFRTPICYTINGTFTYSASNWINMGIDASNVTPYGAGWAFTPPAANPPASGPGVTVNGTNGGITMPLTINVLRPLDVKVYISSLLGYVSVGVWEVLTGGSKNFLGANSTNYSSYGTGPLTVRVSPTTSTNLQVSVGFVSSSALSSPQDMFTVDSIVYEDPTYVQTGGAYVHCTVDSIDVDDKYPFGYNGQMKVNEVAGYGNHNTALFWEYDTRLGRRWNLDPKPTVGISQYSAFGNNPLAGCDPLGDTTKIFNAIGNYVGTLYDKLANQVHFVDIPDGGLDFCRRLIDKLNSGGLKKRNEAATEVRKISLAYISKNSIPGLKGLVMRSASRDKETGIGLLKATSREIFFDEISGRGQETGKEFPSGAVRDYKYRNAALGWGHSHVLGYNTLPKWFYNTKEKIMDNYFLPTARLITDATFETYNYDYQKLWNRTTILIIANPVGITLYNNDTYNSDQLRKQTVYYDWFK